MVRGEAGGGGLGCNDESSSFGERLRESMEVAGATGRQAAIPAPSDGSEGPSSSRARENY
jgi:hypothetical protein